MSSPSMLFWPERIQMEAGNVFGRSARERANVRGSWRIHCQRALQDTSPPVYRFVVQNNNNCPLNSTISQPNRSWLNFRHHSNSQSRSLKGRTMWAAKGRSPAETQFAKSSETKSSPLFLYSPSPFLSFYFPLFCSFLSLTLSCCFSPLSCYFLP